MQILGTVVVRPVLPERIAGLQALSRNLWWSWNHKAQMLFSLLDPDVWQETYHNPVEVLAKVNQTQLEKAAADPNYLEQYDQVLAEFKAYMEPDNTRFSNRFADHKGKVIAYFSAEFGIHESLPIYSGGLGILSGDHIKTASDMGIPLIGVGLLYNHGYFNQQIDSNGWQESSYSCINFANIPCEKALDSQGNEVVIDIEMPDRTVFARVWKLFVGRTTLYLLDTDIEQNSIGDRAISAKLYGGDNNMRIAQEKILGIGGVKALRRLGIDPWVWHMNEGHSAFLTIELMRELVSQGLNWREAIETLSPKVCFTTHTPVPAGQDAFGADLMDMHFWSIRNQLGMTRGEFMRLGQNPNQPDSPFNLTILALKLARFRNGVSKLHGAVSRSLWKGVWPDAAIAEVPIKSITNGVHSGTWIAPELADLFDKHAGTRWRNHPDDTAIWKASKIPSAELWQTHQLLKERMIARARASAKARLKRVGCSTAQLQEIDNILDPNVLTIGFARRFATYKRAILLFSDIERLKKIMFAPGRNVNFVFAGKAHPADKPGQEFIKRIYDLSLMPEFKGRIVLLENYDIDLARHLVSGVDVWLNNPRRPLEASGTSGEKAAMNGVINFSVLDGWWAEGYNGTNGWAIGEERDYSSNEEQDQVDTNSLYVNLEENIVPLYYNRNENNVPTGWTDIMMNSISTLLPVYSTHRMLHDYCYDMYIPAGIAGQQASADNYAQARTLAVWKAELEKKWHEVNLESEFQKAVELKRGQEIAFQVHAYLGKLTPEDVRVELFAGPVVHGEIAEPRIFELNYVGFRDGAHRYEGKLRPDATGTFGYAVRAIPTHPALSMKDSYDFVRWSR